jgi:signal transduction histidine kinase/CheY-like chemotaxis protein/AraC-like DNA-binding protein/predicted negative regulator of RcsB-dependent stress response
MIKIRVFFLMLFAVCSINAQKIEYVSLDSLNKIYNKNYNLSRKVSPESFSKLANNFLKLLNSQKYIHLSKNQKQHQFQQINDHERMAPLRVKTLLDLMLFGTIKNNVDSVNHYQQKISLLTNDSGLLGKSHGITAFAYQNNNLFAEAIKSYVKASDTYSSSNIKKTQYREIFSLVNLTNCLLELGSVEQATITNTKLQKIISDFKAHPRSKNLKELIKVQQARILITSKNFKEAKNILDKVVEKNLDVESLKIEYYDALHDTYNGLENYNLGEYYLEKSIKPNGSIFSEYLDYFHIIDKLQYAIYKKNKSSVDFYFKKLEYSDESSISYFKSYLGEKTISNYYAFKKNYKKAFEFLKKSDSIKNSKNSERVKMKLDIERFYVHLDGELEKMKQLSLKKDDLLVKSRNQYIIIGMFIVIVFASFFIIINNQRKKKQYRLEVSLRAQKTILESKEKFLENMSHEIRTPITSILGYLNLLNEEGLIAEKRIRYTNIAIKNSKKMISSLNNFLTLLSAEKSPVESSQKTSINLTDFIKEITATYLPDFEIKKMNFYYKTNANHNLVITYDIESLKAIINNLISNAIKYSNSNTSVYFSINLTESSLIITVKDQGYGIEKSEKDKIFTRFYQTKKNRTTAGFGIGLSLIDELAKRLKGTITLETEINKGSVFRVELPFKLSNYTLNTSSIQNDFKLLTTDKSLDTKTKGSNNYPKALIVDDNTEMISYLKDIFSDFIDCTFAFNGKEALRNVREKSFDLIISDLRMPEMDGAQFKKELNKIDHYKDIPFILITSVSNLTSLSLKNTLGFNEYIEKPFTKSEIISRVQFSLERTLNRKKILGVDTTNIDFESSSKTLIHQIKECILSNLTNPDFNVVVLSKACGYGQKKLNEILKYKLGLSLVNVILEIRLLKAYELIVKNRYPTLKEVMYAVGINSRPYFYKKFQDRFGIKAGDLKNKHCNLM